MYMQLIWIYKKSKYVINYVFSFLATKNKGDYVECECVWAHSILLRSSILRSSMQLYAIFMCLYSSKLGWVLLSIILKSTFAKLYSVQVTQSEKEKIGSGKSEEKKLFALCRWFVSAQEGKEKKNMLRAYYGIHSVTNEYVHERTTVMR